MVKIIDDSRAIAFICNKLQDAKIAIPPSAHETLLSDYLKRIRRTLVQSHAEHEVDNYLTTLKNQYEQVRISDDEMAWFHHDPRAAFWLLAKLHTSTKSEITGEVSLLDTLPHIRNISLSYTPEYRPTHELRLKNIDDFFNIWTFSRLAKEYVKACHLQWSALIKNKNILHGINKEDDLRWARDYFHNHNILLTDYACGETPDEVLAHCYASYFIWSQSYTTSQSDDELFVKNFKAAWSARKHRNKNTSLNRKTITVPISEVSHQRLEELAQMAGTAKNRALENAIFVAWQKMRGK